MDTQIIEKTAPPRTRESAGDAVFRGVLLLSAIVSALFMAFIFIFIFIRAWPVLRASGMDFLTTGGFSEQVRDSYYLAPREQTLRFGVLGLAAATLLTTLGALLLAVPAGVGTAIVLCEFSGRRTGGAIRSVVRLLACIPSIIYGLVGLMVIVPLIKDTLITPEMQLRYLHDPLLRMQLSGKSLLAGILVLSVMIMPTVTALSADAIRAVPRAYKEAGLALGISHWRVITKILLPAARTGIFAGVILAAGRGTGEAIALSMVSGGISNVPRLAHGGVFFLTPVLTLASAIVNKSEAMSVEAIASALFGCGVVLILTSVLFSLSTKLVERIVGRSRL